MSLKPIRCIYIYIYIWFRRKNGHVALGMSDIPALQTLQVIVAKTESCSLRIVFKEIISQAPWIFPKETQVYAVI